MKTIIFEPAMVDGEILEVSWLVFKKICGESRKINNVCAKWTIELLQIETINAELLDGAPLGTIGRSYPSGWIELDGV